MRVGGQFASGRVAAGIVPAASSPSTVAIFASFDDSVAALAATDGCNAPIRD